MGRLLLNYVLSDPYVDVALVGVREPRFVELNNEISDDVASRIDLVKLHDRYVRQDGAQRLVVARCQRSGRPSVLIVRAPS